MSDEIDARCVTHHHACDCREAAHAADRDRLRRLVAAVRAHMDDGLAACGRGGVVRAPGKAGDVGGLVWRDCIGLGTPHGEQCSLCQLRAELEACEGAE
jgi:hypothetical protein